MPVDQSPGLPGAGGTGGRPGPPGAPAAGRTAGRTGVRTAGVGRIRTGVVVPVTQVDPVAVVDAEDLGADGAVGVVGVRAPS